ncbi:Uncharacterised protein [Legionella steigerwaltii]|uniref:Uncharacterized protein n=1 Tax=Legionella steigerwaltii TaxID=460 RepID=A0A378LET6_9GAMM|nr:hypothetical protein [Legionella steigerwaltii]KTD78630.1 hypothetical protein Lstg_1099 [Legionella steigerwaltii]STY24279.1 Uncharacterised protein [Legionella steigerwaltii]
MQDIQSPSFVEKLTNLLNEVKENEGLKKLLLDNPEQFLASHDIILNDYQIIVEEHAGYGLLFAVQSKETLPPKDTSSTGSFNTFQNVHFLDCLHY